MKRLAIALTGAGIVCGCSAVGSGHQADSAPSGQPADYVEDAAGVGSTEPGPAETCILTLEDLHGFPPPLPEEFDWERHEEGVESRCVYGSQETGDDLFIEVNQYGYSGKTTQIGEGFWMGEGHVCADGKNFDNDFDLTSPETAIADLESFITCHAEPVQDRSRGIQPKNRTYKVYRADLSRGMACTTPTNCYLVTDDVFYFIRLDLPTLTVMPLETDEQFRESYAPLVAVAKTISLKSGES